MSLNISISFFTESCTNISSVSLTHDAFCASPVWETHKEHHLNQLSTTKCVPVFANNTVNLMIYRIKVSLAVQKYDLTVYGKHISCKAPYMIVSTKLGCNSTFYSECEFVNEQNAVTLTIGQPGKTGKSCTYRCGCSSTNCLANVAFYRAQWEDISADINNPKLCLFDVDPA